MKINFRPLWPQIQIMAITFVKGVKLIRMHEPRDHIMSSVRGVAFWKFKQKILILTFDPLKWGHMTRSPLPFWKLWPLSTRWYYRILNWNCLHIFHMVNDFDPCDLYMTLAVTLSRQVEQKTGRKRSRKRIQ